MADEKSVMQQYMERFGDSPPFWAVGNQDAMLKALRSGKPLKEDLPEGDDVVA